jgi:hypothetical protein
LGVLPALVFLAFAGSSAPAGVAGTDLFVSFSFGRPPGVTPGVAAGVLMEGVAREAVEGTEVLRFSLSLKPDILKILRACACRIRTLANSRDSIMLASSWMFVDVEAVGKTRLMISKFATAAAKTASALYSSSRRTLYPCHSCEFSTLVKHLQPRSF